MEEKDLILIERYLAGDATEAERMEVDQRRQADPVFRQELLDLETAQQALRLRQREELRQRFRKRDEELDKKKPELTTHDRRWYVWIGVATVILVLLLLIWNFFLEPGPPAVPAEVESGDSTEIREEGQVQDSTMMQKPDEEDSPKKEDEKKPKPKDDVKQNKGGELFAANFEPYRDPMMDPTTRGESKPTSPDDFRKAYWEERYQEVPALFQKLDPTYQQNDNYRFQLANALMENGKVDEAIPILESIIQNNRSRFVAEAYFYLGLGYLKKGNETSAEKWLNDYVRLEKAKQKDRANEILKLLE